METRKIQIDHIPALIWGAKSDRVYIYVHGKNGRKEAAERLAEEGQAKGFQVISFDFPEHGERKNEGGALPNSELRS